MGEVVCRCAGYPFPHRMMGGRCNGGAFVYDLFERQSWGSCRDCVFRVVDAEGLKCQVLEGLDAIIECPDLAEYIRFEGIQLYGVNRAPEKRSGWRR